MPGETLNISNNAALGMQPRYLQNMYANMSNFNSLSEDVMGGAFNTSCFGSGFGGGMGYGGMGYGYGPGSERMNMTEIEAMRYDAKLRSTQMDYAVEEKKIKEVNEFRMKAPKAESLKAIGNLHDSITNNDQGNVIGQHGALVSAIKKELDEVGYYDYTPEQLNAIADTRYKEATGKSVYKDLEQYKDSAFKEGLKNGLDPFNWFHSKASGTDNAAKIRGVDVSESEKSGITTGSVVGTIGLVAGAIGAALLLRKGGNVAHFIRDTRLTSRINRLENSLVHAKSAAKASKSQEAKDAVKRIQDVLKTTKTTHADANAEWQAKKAEKLARRSQRTANRLQGGWWLP